MLGLRHPREIFVLADEVGRRLRPRKAKLLGNHRRERAAGIIVGRDHRADPPTAELAEDALELGERVLHLAATNGLRPDQRLEARTRVVVVDKLRIAAAEQLQLAVVAMGRADDENGSRQAHSISAAPKLWSDGLQNSPLRRAA